MAFGFKKTAANGKPAEPSGAVEAPSPAKPAPAVTIPNLKAPPATRPALAGAPAGPGGQPASEDAKRLAMATLQRSAALGQIIAVLMRSPQHKFLTLADLEWLVFPPLVTGQFAIAEVRAKDAAAGVPAALVLWASVSAEVDKKLTENPGAPIKLRPDEWKSGDILWLIEAVGDARVVPQFLKELSEKALKGRSVKVRTRDKDGKAIVSTLSDATAPAPPS